MTLENTFYTLGIIVMSMGFILLLSLLVLVFFIMKKVNAMYHMVDERMQALKEITDNPAEAAISFGAKLTQTALKKFSERKKDEK